MMWSSLSNGTAAFRATFHQSAVIWFARVQILLGAIWAVLVATDLSSVIGNPKYITGWLIFSGVVTEMTRRARTVQDDDGHLIPRRNDDDHVTVVVNNASAAPAPASPLGPSTGATK
jgi:hypothetical protein